MPAAAVIPALIVYVKVVAVKTLVVGCSGGIGGSGALCVQGRRGSLRAMLD